VLTDHSDETLTAVKAWLVSAGISEERIRTSQSLGFFDFDASVSEVEDLLNAEYHVYEHQETGQPHVACEEYSIPAHLQNHIEFVYPTVNFDTKVIPRDPAPSEEKRDVVHDVGLPGSGSLPKLGQYMSAKSIIQELKNCDKQIVPDCLRLLYEFPRALKATPGNSYGIVEYTPQAYVGSDLDLFFANFSPYQIGDRPIFDSIDGGVVQTTNRSFNFNGESDLDLEYALNLVYPTNVTLYQAGDLVQGASFNNFLDAIDVSCSWSSSISQANKCHRAVIAHTKVVMIRISMESTQTLFVAE
jgi:tripeptidyl-peptidase I